MNNGEKYHWIYIIILIVIFLVAGILGYISDKNRPEVNEPVNNNPVIDNNIESEEINK